MATQLELANIAENIDFQRRVRYLMVNAAVAQLNGEPAAADILLGQRILKLQEPVYAWALAVVTNSTIAAGAHAADGATIVEGDLEFTVNSLWSAFAV
jgi:hypothetical protein